MFCNKRGQVTIYIIIGVVIAATVIILFAVLRQQPSEDASSSDFSEKVGALKNQVSRCLKSATESSVYELANAKVSDYDTELKNRIKKKAELCLNFDTYRGAVVEQEPIKSLSVAMSDEKTKITVEMTKPMTIMANDNRAQLSSFSAEVKLLKQCCIPVDVDDDCQALESGEFKACGIMLELSKGQKVLYGGECVAC